MLARGFSYALVGLDVLPIEIEVDTAPGLPALTLVGLPDQAVREARERVRSALANSQFDLPDHRITVNLAPADLKKEGGAFDLGIALGVLASSGQVEPAALERVAVVGELALDGSLRPARGVLPIALALRGSRPRRTLVVPRANAAEAIVVDGVQVVAVQSLREAVDVLAGRVPPQELDGHPDEAGPRADGAPVDFADVKGQHLAKRALEVAVAGGHHVLMIGPPGAGKSMLAQRLPTIQPDLTPEEALETAKIHSVMGLLPPFRALPRQRPFRAPHHTSSAEALIGGGPSVRPGELSLAHHGVLFLDELPEFHRDVLESLRQPLEEGVVSVARAKRSLQFPARVMLVAAMNPCPCGYATDGRRRCVCPSTKVERYLAKVSGPLLDRIDVHIEVPAVPTPALLQPAAGEPSTAIKARVVAARARQQQRLGAGGVSTNAQMRHRELQKSCPLTAAARTLLRQAVEEWRVSARGYDKLLKLARTIADLAAAEAIGPEHLAEAMHYRSLDRRLWG